MVIRVGNGGERDYMPLLVAGLLLCVLVTPAFAYIDLGTGSYIFQVAAALFIGFLFTLKIYWQNFLSFLKRFFKR